MIRFLLALFLVTLSFPGVAQPQTNEKALQESVEQLRSSAIHSSI